MTTIVTVTTSEHPAHVLGFPLVDREPVGGVEYRMIAEVPPGTTQEFASTADEDILVREIEAEAEAEQAEHDAPIDSEELPESEAA